MSPDIDDQNPIDSAPPAPSELPPSQQSETYNRIVEQRQEMVAQLAAQRFTIREIESILAKAGVINPTTGKPWSRDTIHKDILAAREQWRQNTLASMDTLIKEQLAQIRAAQKRCWMDGDLNNLAKFVDREAKLLGTDKPEKTEQTVNLDGQLVIPGIDRMDPESLKLMQQMVDIFKDAD